MFKVVSMFVWEKLIVASRNPEAVQTVKNGWILMIRQNSGVKYEQ